MKKIYIYDEMAVKYLESGRGNPIIFLHGWGQSGDCFRSSIDALSKEYRVFALDLPGFGESDEPGVDYGVYEYAKLLNCFINDLGLNNPILVGHSFGGRVCLIHSSKYDVAGVVLTGAAGIRPRRSFKGRLSAYNYKFMKLLVKTPLYSHYREDLYKTSGSVDYKAASDVMKRVLVNTVNEDLTYCLELIDAPTLLVWGENDDATPVSDGYVMNELIRDSELVVYPGSGHYAFLENIDNFNILIANFIKKCM